ncbi:MAG TPA: prolyl oligopeptidase family serine peptidase [Cyclobacteriaceae bacterium]|nr:prolyl oligopeptidase family serine peptidase [Cyclobacteriaceae bacterium]
MRLHIMLALVGIAATCHAQKNKTVSASVQKKPLSHTEYDSWKDIPSKLISPDGSVAAIVINPQDGDGKVVFYHLKTNQQDSVKRAADIQITFNSRYAAFKIKPQQKLIKELRRQKKKREDLPKDSLGLYAFTSRKTEKIPDVKSYKIPEKDGGWIAYQLEAVKEVKPKVTAPKPNEEKKEERKPEKPKKKKINNDDNGYTLVLRNLLTSKTVSFGFVKDYTFAKYGQGLLFASSGNDSTMKAGVYWYDLKNEKMQALYEGKSKYKFKGLSISEDGTQTAFLVDTDTTKAPLHYYRMHYWKNGNPSASLLVDEKNPSLPTGWIVSEHATPLFAKDGSKLFFGATPKPVLQDTALLAEEIVSVEVWNWQDDYIYPQQNKQLDEEKKRSYLFTINPITTKVTQLGSKEIPGIELGDQGNADVVLGETNVPYRDMIVYDPAAFSDFYLFNIKDGTRTTIATKVKGNASLSAKANYVSWYSQPDTAWFAYHIANSKLIRLTQKMKVSFADEEDDHPDYPSAYGSAGWTANDQQLLIYDRYDIWAFDPQGNQEPINLTKIGRQEKTVFRYLRLDAEERFIDPGKELLLSAFNETTKASGYYKLSLNDMKLTRLVMDNCRFGGLVKAKASNQVLYTRETFREFPDVWTSDLSLANSKKISDANPQMKNFFWGNVEIVNWISADNIPLQGLLYKPEGFDPKKKYPMIVNFYEKETDNLHAHTKPEPLRSTINKATYVSNGYLVFVPDIVYKIGFPGESAHNCILPGVTSLIAKGFVDEKNIGIQGHSWGGYQIAYLMTRTNMFKAAEAGAPVANMTSAYGGIRWESGLSRMFQYEHSQSRIGGTLWQKPMLYIENSPLFFIDKIQTPMLLLHNDADGAVPWYQGIEMYMAMRRLSKPVWMLNYNGEPHWPVKRENRMDFQVRMMQFFNHYLKGAPAPAWMTKGVPAVEKGIVTGY